MKKEERESKKNEIVIAPWINSHTRRATPPAKAVAVYEETPQEETSELETKSPKGWHKALAIIGLSVAAALAGAYLCNGYIIPPTPTPVKARPEVHTVEPGDTLWSVASKYGDDSQDIRQVYYRIMKDNNIGFKDDIHPGQQLIINF